MTLIMKEAAHAGDFLTVDTKDMGVRPVRSESEPIVGVAARSIKRGEYVDMLSNDVFRENLKRAWLIYADKVT